MSKEAKALQENYGAAKWHMVRLDNEGYDLRYIVAWLVMNDYKPLGRLRFTGPMVYQVIKKSKAALLTK